MPEVLTRGINPLLIVATLSLAAYALFGANPYGLRVLTVAGVYAIAVIGYQTIFGQAGALSLAQGTFFGLGAYVTGILGSKFGLGFPVTFPLSILARPVRSENRPPASSTITWTAARSHSRKLVASTAPSTAPSATSMCAQKSPSPRACQVRRASAGTRFSRGRLRTASSRLEIVDTRAGSPPAYAPEPRSAHQRRLRAGAETTPRRTASDSSSAIKVAQIGMPRA